MPGVKISVEIEKREQQKRLTKLKADSKINKMDKSIARLTKLIEGDPNQNYE